MVPTRLGLFELGAMTGDDRGQMSKVIRDQVFEVLGVLGWMVQDIGGDLVDTLCLCLLGHGMQIDL